MVTDSNGYGYLVEHPHAGEHFTSHVADAGNTWLTLETRQALAVVGRVDLAVAAMEEAVILIDR